MLAHAYNIIIDRGFGAPRHGRKIVDGLNDTEKRFLSMITTSVQLPGAEAYESRMKINTSTANTDISLARGIPKEPFRPNKGTWHVGSQ